MHQTETLFLVSSHSNRYGNGAHKGAQIPAEHFCSVTTAHQALSENVIHRLDKITLTRNPFAYCPGHILIWGVGHRSQEGPTARSLSQLSETEQASFWETADRIHAIRPNHMLVTNYATTPGKGNAQSLPLVHAHVLPDPSGMQTRDGYQVDRIDTGDDANRNIIHFAAGLNDVNAALVRQFITDHAGDIAFEGSTLCKDHDDYQLHLKLPGSHRYHRSNTELFMHVYCLAESFLSDVLMGKYPKISRLYQQSQCFQEGIPMSAALGFSCGITDDDMRIKFVFNESTINPLSGEKGRQAGGGFTLIGGLANRNPNHPPLLPEEEASRNAASQLLAMEVREALRHLV